MTEREITFESDKQTLRDIDLFDHGRPGLVFALFNHTRTLGGLARLAKLLRDPMQQIGPLETRRDAIRFFVGSSSRFPFGKQELDKVEQYLASGIFVLEKNMPDRLIYQVRNTLSPTSNYYTIATGITATISVLHRLYAFASSLLQQGASVYLTDMAHTIRDCISSNAVSELLLSPPAKNLSGVDRIRCDHTFRKDGKGQVRMLLDCIYELDALGSVAIAARQYHLCFPEYLPGAASAIQVQGLFHPLLTNPVGNNFTIAKNTNLGFITGANMSGKSTFLKSFGLAVYLAHLGFPVPAQKMETTVFNGLITTINLPDNIYKGYSHFYSEVKRVKETALQIKAKGRIVVIFDELFRGTNVKDARDASLLITTAFAGIRNSLFLISTHIVEIADELKKHDNIFFACFDSFLDGEIPVFNHKLKTGISKERVGMLIVRNEKIIELLAEIRKE